MNELKRFYIINDNFKSIINDIFFFDFREKNNFNHFVEKYNKVIKQVNEKILNNQNITQELNTLNQIYNEIYMQYKFGIKSVLNDE